MLNQGATAGRGCACTEVKLIDPSHPSIQILFSPNYLMRSEQKLNKDLLLNFGSCRPVKQPLPANVQALAQWE